MFTTKKKKKKESNYLLFWVKTRIVIFQKYSPDSCQKKWNPLDYVPCHVVALGSHSSSNIIKGNDKESIVVKRHFNSYEKDCRFILSGTPTNAMLDKYKIRIITPKILTYHFSVENHPIFYFCKIEPWRFNFL